MPPGLSQAGHPPVIGRWMERDPLQYVNGMSMLEYARTAPSLWSDASGLDITIDHRAADSTFYDTVLHSLQDLVGDCATLTLNRSTYTYSELHYAVVKVRGNHLGVTSWRESKEGTVSATIQYAESVTGKDGACKNAACWKILKDLLDNKSVQIRPSQYGTNKTTWNYDKSHSDITVDPNSKTVVWTDPPGGNLVAELMPFEIVLWHELMHSSSGFKDQPDWKTLNSAGFVNPMMQLENVGRKCLNATKGCSISPRYEGPGSYFDFAGDPKPGSSGRKLRDGETRNRPKPLY